jgi:hypothetical protein
MVWPQQRMITHFLNTILFIVCYLVCSFASDRIPTLVIQGGFQNALHEQGFPAMRGPEIGYYPKGFIVIAGFGFEGLRRRSFDRLTIDGVLRAYLTQDYSGELKEKWHVYTI